MAETEPENNNADESDGKKKGPPMMLVGLAGAVILGAATFAGVYFFMPKKQTPHTEYADAGHYEEKAAPGDAAKTGLARKDGPSTYYDIEPIIISLSPDARSRHLRIAMTLEIAESDYDHFEYTAPRIKDVLTTYLRAVDESDLQNPASMARLRAQILRRLRLVSGDADIRTLLITEYLLS